MTVDQEEIAAATATVSRGNKDFDRRCTNLMPKPKPSAAWAASYQEILKWPKVELHAHLNGCIREQTLMELARERNVLLSSRLFACNNMNQHHQKDQKVDNEENHQMYHVSPRSLQDCFDMFAEIPKAVNDLVALERITLEALQDFAAHHVVYVELRTTPKCLLVRHNDDDDEKPQQRSDKRGYLQTVLKVLREFEQHEEERYQQEMQANNVDHQNIRLPMVCRLIVAVDRGQSLSEASENVDLALELARQQTTSNGDYDPKIVVGVDLGGNPTKQDFLLFRPLFEKVKALQKNERGLGITLHCAEIPCASHDGGGDTNTNHESKEEAEQQRLQQARQEAKEMLEFRPNRLGHALLLPDDLKQVLSENPIPVETCPTSNLLTLELAQAHRGQQQHPTNLEGNDENHHHRHHQVLIQALQQHHPTLSEWVVTVPGKSDKSTNTYDASVRDKSYSGFPLAVSTDDPGVFSTNATQELVLLQHAFEHVLDSERLQSLVWQSLDYAFCTDSTKEKIRQRWKKWRQLQQPHQEDSGS
ncbi:hypothetical protein ACA910_013655 [Epithemia clementina (nom. ined.)]